MTLSKIISIYYVRHHWNGFLRHRHSYLRMNGNLPMKMFLLNSGYCYYFLKEKKSYCYAENFHYNYYKNGKNCYSLRVPYTGDSKNGKNPNRLHFHERSVYVLPLQQKNVWKKMYVQKFLHLYDFLLLYSYGHLHQNLYDSEPLPTNEHVPYCYFAKRLHFHDQQKFDYRQMHGKIRFHLYLHTNDVLRKFSILYNYVYTVKHNDGDDAPKSHPNIHRPNNQAPSPKTGPSSRHRSRPNPSRSRRTDRSPNSGPGCRSRDHTNRRTSHHTIRCTTDHSNRPSRCRCSH